MIKQPFFAACSLILLVVVAGYSVERFFFLRSAEHTMGNVVNVESYNGLCGSRRYKYDCTKYKASVDFFALNKLKYNLVVSAGSERGHNKSVGYASFKLNDLVPVVYDPEAPSKSYEDTLWGVWGNPIMLLFFQISFFLTSITERHRRRELA